MSSQKSLTQLAADSAAMFSAGNNVSATDFAAFIANLLKSLNLPLPLPEVVTFTGADNSLENVGTENLAINTLVQIVVSNVVHKYILLTGTELTQGTYFIRPKDYREGTNEKYWKRTDILIKKFNRSDLVENQFIITHDLGYTYIKEISVYEVSSKMMLMRVFESPTNRSEFSQIPNTENEVRLRFHGDLNSDHLAIISL